MKIKMIQLINKLGFLPHFNLMSKVNLRQSTFHIPILHGVGYEHLFLPEKWMLDILPQVIQFSHGCFLDVGVNTGQTLLKIKSINPEIKYVGFEPNISCVQYTEMLVAKNSIKNVVIIPVALSNQTGQSPLFLYSDKHTDSSASLVQSFRPGEKIFSQQIVNKSSLIEMEKKYPIPKIGILKIDVEGVEYEVLDTCSDRIQQDRPLIMLEILPVYSMDNKDRWLRQQQIEKMLKDWNYVMYRVIKKNQSFIGLKKIETIGIHHDISQCDYVVCPIEKTTNLLFTKNDF
ncbi:MAG: FkbM family methyltransferase [Saprospiraceae bacterium]